MHNLFLGAGSYRATFTAAGASVLQPGTCTVFTVLRLFEIFSCSGVATFFMCSFAMSVAPWLVVYLHFNSLIQYT